VDAGALAAGQAFEAALNLGPSPQARSGLADALLMRVMRARAEHHPAGELIARLGLYDDDGSRRARLEAPARLTVSSPEGTSLVIARYGPDFALEPARPLVPDASLAPGSYLLTSRGPDGAEVRLPILLTPGEARRVALHPPASVPPDFVFVPGGTFLSGSSGPSAFRQGFLSAAPLHAVHTAAFLIARHETTFGEWIAFLNALPPAARAARLPRVGSGGFRGALALTRTRGGWRLDFEPAGERFRLLEGERLHYPGRTRLASVDWRTLPVVGISAPDAEAYVAWLRRSGRVPGARLCSELEWERAARGADGRAYPGGDTLDPSAANFDQSHPEGPHAAGPDPVGAHPASRSPFGVDDLAGNVWEWTRSFDRAGGYTARGGSFAYGRIAALSANRELLEPGFRDVALGLRVCADAPAGTR
jgi:formylglycine-generating enzyme required for sulfatase activity